MYQPNLTVSYKILNNIVEIEKLFNTLNEKELQSKVILEIKKKNRAMNLFHMAHIIGVELSINDASKAAKGNKITTDDARGTILNNYRNIYNYVHSTAKGSYIAFDLNLLLQFNKLLLSEWQDEWQVKIRSSVDEKENYLDSWGNYFDKNIEPTRLQGEVLSLLDWYTNNNDINSILKVATFTYRMTRLAPFKMLNKLTIISLIEYLLAKEGYNAKELFTLSRVFDLGEQNLLQTVLYAIDNEDDITLYVENFTQSLLLNVQDANARLNRSISNNSKSIKKPFLDLNKRQLKILRYLQTIPTVRREEYVQMMEVSSMTSYRDLKELVEKKLLKSEGEGRATRYMLINR